MRKINKKGQAFEQLGGLATGIAALAIILTVAFLVMSEGKTQSLDLTESSSFVNQTTTITVDQFSTVGNCVNELSLSVTEVYNGTAGDFNVLLTSANYTVLLNQLNVSNDNLLDTLGSNINVSYSCKEPDHAYNGTESLQNATNEIPGWIPIIVIVVIGGILLSLVALFRRR